MLQSLRQQASSWIVKVLFALLILSFGLWGINDIFLGERDPVVAKVGGAKITYSQLDEGLRQEVWRLQPLFGDSLDREQAKKLGLLDQALDKLVDRAVFALAIDDYGLQVNDQMILRHIHNEPAFHNAAGQFDRYVMQQALSQNAMNEATYVAGLRRDLPANQLIGAITAATPAPESLLESLHRYREEGRVAETISVPAASSPTPPLPDDAVVEAYYKANIERFMTPEMRTVSVALINPETLAEDISVSDDKLKSEYENRIADYTVAERREVDQAVLQDEAQAKQVSDLLGQGKDLAEALKEAKAGVGVIDLGWVARSDLIGEIGDAAFALSAGQHSAPIKSSLGWHIIRVKKVEPGRVKPFEEVRDELRKSIIDHDAADRAHDLAIKLEDALASGANLEEAATETGLKPIQLAPFDAKGLTAEGKAASVLTAQPRFMRAAFETPQGQESQLLELPDNVFAVVRVEQIASPAAKPLDTVKSEVVALWQQAERMKSAKTRADGLVERIAKGEAPAALAAAGKLTLATTPAFTRQPSDADTALPPSVKARLFDLKPGEAAAGETDDGYVVAVLKEIKPAPALAAPARAELETQLSRAIADDLVDQLAVALRGRYHVEVRRDVIDSRF